jgi:hypothetical protein
MRGKRSPIGRRAGAESSSAADAGVGAALDADAGAGAVLELASVGMVDAGEGAGPERRARQRWMQGQALSLMRMQRRLRKERRGGTRGGGGAAALLPCRS